MSETHRQLSNIIIGPGPPHPARVAAGCDASHRPQNRASGPPSIRVKITHGLANFFRRYSEGRQPIHLVKAFEKTNGF
jgi:hypothetical protein